MPDAPLSAADVVGRAVRLTRLNWKQYILLFLVPSAFYSMQYFPSMWLAQHDYGIYAWAWVGLIAMILVIFPHWEICVRMFAVFSLIFGHAEDYQSSLAQARKKSWLILFINAPTILSDIYLLSVVELSSYLVTQGGKGARHGLEASLGLGLDVLIWILILPVTVLTILNTFFVATLVAEKLTVWQCCNRWLYFMRAQWLYIFGYATILGIFYLLIESAVDLVSLFGLLIDQLPGMVREIAIIGLLVFEAVLISPVTAFIAGTISIGSAYLHDQIVMRLECSDILRRINTSNAG